MMSKYEQNVACRTCVSNGVYLSALGDQYSDGALPRSIESLCPSVKLGFRSILDWSRGLILLFIYIEPPISCPWLSAHTRKLSSSIPADNLLWINISNVSYWPRKPLSLVCWSETICILSWFISDRLMVHLIHFKGYLIVYIHPVIKFSLNLVNESLMCYAKDNHWLLWQWILSSY